jgi:RNA methyltransferase, TrmH family
MLTSPSNPRIKLIRKLHERKARQESGLFYMEGLRIVAEALETHARLDYLVYCPDLLTNSFGKQTLAKAVQSGIEALEVNADTFHGFALKEGPQGLAAVARQHWTPLEEVNPDPGALWIALDAVADPGNLGTILRTGDSAGARGLILLDNATDPFDPTAVRASMGSIFAQKVVKTGAAEFLAWKKATGFPLVGTTGAASDLYHAVRYPSPCILLSGSERQGLSQPLLAACDLLVKIPMVGRSDSLNLAVATGIVLYEIFNQRKQA